MPTRFQRRFQVHALPVLEREFSSQVQLRNGSDLSVAFTAIYKDQEYEIDGYEVGLFIKDVRRDYYLPVASCLINSVAVEPARGMFVIDEDGSEREILPPNQSKPEVELLPGGYRYLVRTKEVAASVC